MASFDGCCYQSLVYLPISSPVFSWCPFKSCNCLQQQLPPPNKEKEICITDQISTCYGRTTCPISDNNQTPLSIGLLLDDSSMGGRPIPKWGNITLPYMPITQAAKGLNIEGTLTPKKPHRRRAFIDLILGSFDNQTWDWRSCEWLRSFIEIHFGIQPILTWRSNPTKSSRISEQILKTSCIWAKLHV